MRQIAKRIILAVVVFELMPGFVRAGTVFSYTTIDVPGELSTNAWGINDAGEIVGQFENASDQGSFLYAGGVFTTIDVPGMASPFAYGINDRGQVVFSQGYYPGTEYSQ